MSQDKTERMEYFISLLDDYIDGKLDVTQTGEIKKALQEDPFLNEVLKQHVQARANMRIAGEEELRKKFAGNFDPIPEEPVAKPSLLKYLIPILLLLGLAAGAYYYLSTQTEVEPKHMANEMDNDDRLLLASVEDPSYDLLRSEQDTMVANKWQEAVKSFVSKDYNQTLNVLTTLESDSLFLKNHIGKFSLMKGVANLKLEQYNEANRAFNYIDSENPFYDQAEWYLALSYYYAKDVTVAKTQLEKIANSESHFKKSQAQKYLAQIAQ